MDEVFLLLFVHKKKDLLESVAEPPSRRLGEPYHHFAAFAAGGDVGVLRVLLRQRASVQLSEKARAEVLNGRPSRTRGQGVPAAAMPFTTRRAPETGTSTVQTP